MAESFFTDDDIACLRESASLLLNDRATILRLKPIGTGDGFRAKSSQRYPEDYAEHLTNEPCHLSAAQSRRQESIAGSQVRATGDWKIRFKAGTDVDEKDIVVITTLSSRKFDIVGLLAGSDEVVRIVEANERR